MSSAPLAPDDDVHDREFGDADFAGEHALHNQRVSRAGDRPSRNRPLSASRPSRVRRMFRTITRFLVAVLIGIGLTLAWQSYGEQAKQIARTFVPSLAWVLPDAVVKSTNEADVLPEVAQQIKLVALDVAIVRRSIGELATNQVQLAAKQDQMTQDIAALQELEQDARQKAASPAAPRPAHPAAQNSLQLVPR
jgi:outer membrane murein-binding lipoprotein Lpp